MVLSVADILNGIDEYQEVRIESIDDTMYLRPLSKGEWDKIQAIRQESLGDYVSNEKTTAASRRQRAAQIESRLSFNIKENGEADSQAQVETIFLSLDTPGNETKTTRKEIEKLPPNVFDEIYDNVLKISGIDENTDLEEDVNDFPEDE